MPFKIRYNTTTDVTPPLTYQAPSYTEITLNPNPTEVQYPETREYNARTTQDHAVVIQRPIIDNRERTWTWKNFRRTITGYESQWATLVSLEARQRALDDVDPIIEIWENETEEGGFGGGSLGSEVWTKVKFIQVHRKSRGGGGPTVYDDSTVTFIIADPAWENF